MGLDDLMVDLGVEQANESILFLLILRSLIICDVVKDDYLAFLLLPDEVMALDYYELLIVTISSAGLNKNVGLDLSML